MNQKTANGIVYGGDYNPDQWLHRKEIWDEDLRLMRLARVNSATVGIFAWSALEPEEGVYNFGWLDEIMDRLYRNGQRVILATPSGARPAWLAAAYPEVLRVREDGVRLEFGGRHNHCLTSPVYRRKVREMNEMLAERYKNHPALAMWHVSNEYSGACFCPLCREAFRKWLRNRYDNDLEKLNAAWWNGFWSHRVTDWLQIDPPSEIGERENPGLTLAWRRFVSDSHIGFFENEIAPLKAITPGVPVTTNLMRMYPGIDYQKLAKRMDVVSWDNYPAWGLGDDAHAAMETAFTHDAFRSMKHKPFYMMESTPSVVNWRGVNKLPRPGVQTLTAVQALAHGADSVQYFQWRAGRGGHEKYHGAVVDHSGHEHTRVFREAAATGELLEKLAFLSGAPNKARAAVIYDWENGWAIEGFRGFNNERRDYLGACLSWYAPLWEQGVSADVIPMDAPFDGYDLVIAPFLYMLKDGTAERIARYVENGGAFVGTCLTGMVNADDLCFTGGFPAGALRQVFGVWHEETDAIPEGTEAYASFLGKSYPVRAVCDLLHAEGADVLGTYETDFYSGTPAVTANAFGRGKAYYAAFRSDGSLERDVCAYLLRELGVPKDGPVEAPGLSLKRRGDCLFLMNFTDAPKTAELRGEYLDAPTGAPVGDSLTVGPYGYAVLRDAAANG